MFLSSRIRKIIRQHQTAKQLRYLPDHLLNDLAITQEQAKAEIRKCALISLLFSLISIKKQSKK